MSCNVCELPVTKTDSEVAIQFAYDGADPHQDQFHLHVRCFAVGTGANHGRARPGL